MSYIIPMSLYFTPLYPVSVLVNWVIVFLISMVISDWVMPWNVSERIHATKEIRRPTLIWLFLAFVLQCHTAILFRLVVTVSTNGKIIVLFSQLPSFCYSQYYSISHGAVFNTLLQPVLSPRNHSSWQKLSVIRIILQLSETPNLPSFTTLSKVFERPNRTY